MTGALNSERRRPKTSFSRVQRREPLKTLVRWPSPQAAASMVTLRPNAQSQAVTSTRVSEISCP
ncbi:hypothetical protein ACQ4WX_17345 [Streptomyces lasalocidi]